MSNGRSRDFFLLATILDATGAEKEEEEEDRRWRRRRSRRVTRCRSPPQSLSNSSRRMSFYVDRPSPAIARDRAPRTPPVDAPPHFIELRHRRPLAGVARPSLSIANMGCGMAKLRNCEAFAIGSGFIPPITAVFFFSVFSGINFSVMMYLFSTRVVTKKTKDLIIIINK